MRLIDADKILEALEAFTDNRRIMNELKKDMENMENCMIRLGGRTDIWQDRMIYVICKAVLDLCRWAIRREQRDETHNLSL